MSTSDEDDPFTAPHFARSALLIIDTQVDFLDGGASPIDGTTERLPSMSELVKAYRGAHRPIVHVIRIYEDEDIDIVRRQALMSDGQVVRAGTDGANIPSELLIDPTLKLRAEKLLAGSLQEIGSNEVVMWKPRWSAFFRTPLEQHLSALDVDTVVVAGCNFPNCPRATIFDASELDLRVVIAVDAVSQMTPERLADSEAIGARPMSTTEIVKAVTGQRSAVTADAPRSRSAKTAG